MLFILNFSVPCNFLNFLLAYKAHKNDKMDERKEKSIKCKHKNLLFIVLLTKTTAKVL